MSKVSLIPSVLLVILGILDCLTTMIGVQWLGTTEKNPIMATLVNTNLAAFAAVKIAATIFVAFTYLLANRILMKTKEKNSKSFVFTSKFMKIAYLGITAFLVTVIANNLIILMG
jgi:uncharacterized membrane protein